MAHGADGELPDCMPKTTKTESSQPLSQSKPSACTTEPGLLPTIKTEPGVNSNREAALPNCQTVPPAAVKAEPVTVKKEPQENPGKPVQEAYFSPAEMAEMSAKIEMYAKTVAGVPEKYLEFLDGYLCSMLSDKYLSLIIDKEADLEISSVKDYLKGAAPHIDTDDDPRPMDRSSKDSWLLLAVSADYNPKSMVKNHWIPCFFKEQVSAKAWEQMTTDFFSKLNREIQDLQERLSALENGGESPDPDPEVAMTITDSLCTRLETTRRLLALATRCRDELGVCIVPVPADGDCMIWSLKALTLQEHEPVDYTSAFHKRECKRFRWMLRNMWLDVKNQEGWVGLFDAFFHDWIPPLTAETDDHEGAPRTPRRRKRPADDGDVGKSTPPRPSQKGRVERDGQTRGVPLAVPTPASPTLKKPGSKRRRGVLEPEEPDIEEAFHQAMQQEEAPGRVDFDDLEGGLEANDGDDMPQKKIARTQHTRSVKAKDKKVCEPAARMNRLKALLSKLQFKYDDFQRFHSTHAAVRKASACLHGGYNKFKLSLLAGDIPNCPACQKWLQDNELSPGKIADLLQDDGLDPLTCQSQNHKQTEATEGEDQENGEGAANTEKTEQPEPATQRGIPACQEFMRTFDPDIDLVIAGDGTLYGKCLLCTTKRMPGGKMFKLGNGSLKGLQYFLDQHCMGDKHRAAVHQRQQRNTSGPDGSDPADGDESAAAAPLLQCPAYNVGNPESPGTLKLFKEEFNLWANYTKMEGKCSHQYWQFGNEGAWHIRHLSCAGQFSPSPDRPGATMCSHCADIGSPKNLQRRVMRFIEKFYLALYLNKKLFGTPGDVQEFLERVKKSNYGLHHEESWKKKISMQLLEIQTDVRRSFCSYKEEEISETQQLFINSVVRPCLKVNVCSVNDNLAGLASQYVTALQNRRLSESRIAIGFFSLAGISDFECFCFFTFTHILLHLLIIFDWDILRICGDQELEECNVQIAQAAVSGKLDSNPMVQGILMACLRRIGKEERGVTSHAGRHPSCTQTEHDLISNTAFSFALAGGNRELALDLGQNLRPPSLKLEDLAGFGLPNPLLALCPSRSSQLQSNLELIDQQYERAPDQKTRRLMAALDCTYLQKSFCQLKIEEEAGLIGAAWHPMATEDRSFMSLSNMPADGLKTPKAPLMLEVLTWDPTARHNRTLSAAAMPMALKPMQEQKAVRNHGKWASWQSLDAVLFFLLCYAVLIWFFGLDVSGIVMSCLDIYCCVMLRCKNVWGDAAGGLQSDVKRIVAHQSFDFRCPWESCVDQRDCIWPVWNHQGSWHRRASVLQSIDMGWPAKTRSPAPAFTLVHPWGQCHLGFARLLWLAVVLSGMFLFLVEMFLICYRKRCNVFQFWFGLRARSRGEGRGRPNQFTPPVNHDGEICCWHDGLSWLWPPSHRLHKSQSDVGRVALHAVQSLFCHLSTSPWALYEYFTFSNVFICFPYISIFF